ncbi:MAG: DUF1553 domain-containing protein [Verrucomicrobia bacterium]|nr:DUF1553 domain-containing protein [Verrucomicrobiota bacterium]
MEFGQRFRATGTFCVLLLAFALPARGAADPAGRAEAWKSHWAFRPIIAPPPPPVRSARWARTGLDRFVLAELESHGLTPSPAADRRVLARRLSFNLHGLPPSPEFVEDFVADPDPNAYARLVDRLLESPRYGERWGRHWLDVARYADNKGYVFFEERSYPWAHTYRDYVVRSFNEDLPFNRFLLEQIAADQLDLGTNRSALAAMGFLTVGDHMVNNTHDIIDDRIDVLSRGLMGITVACARCHDHKFDPITQADYYGLYGVLRSSVEPMAPPLAAPAPTTEAYEGFELERVRREGRLREFVEQKHGEIVSGGRARIAEYLLAAYDARHHPLTENFMILADKGDLNPTVILRWRLFLERARTVSPQIWKPWHTFADQDASQFDTNLGSTARAPLSEVEGLNPRVAAAFRGPPPRDMKDVAARYERALLQVEKAWQAALEKARSAGLPEPGGLEDPGDEALRRALHGPDAPPDVPGTMDWGFISLLPDRASQAEFQKLITDLEQWLMHGPDAPARAMVMEEARAPYEPRIFQRGNPNRLGESVPRAFPRFLNPQGAPFHHGSGRGELADAIVDPSNPLTARVFVNRVWAHHFGAGLVATPSDFGLRSEPPVHARLLDHLASGFMAHNWSVKWLQRTILNSAVFQQSGHDRAECAAVDPDNRWLWRMNRGRHDFETLRDSMLSASGRLDPTLGGPPVAANSTRRTLYLFVDRMDLPSLYSTFDFPSPSSSCPQRASTTVAPQALYLMNNEFADVSARGLLSRADVAPLRSEARVERLYKILFARSASAEETRWAHQFLRDGSDKRWRDYVHGLLMSNEFAFVD